MAQEFLDDVRREAGGQGFGGEDSPAEVVRGVGNRIPGGTGEPGFAADLAEDAVDVAAGDRPGGAIESFACGALEQEGQRLAVLALGVVVGDRGAGRCAGRRRGRGG